MTHAQEVARSLAGDPIGLPAAATSAEELVAALGISPVAPAGVLLLLGVASEITLLVALILTPPLARIFGLVPVSFEEWRILLLFPAVILLAEEARKWIARHWPASPVAADGGGRTSSPKPGWTPRGVTAIVPPTSFPSLEQRDSSDVGTWKKGPGSMSERKGVRMGVVGMLMLSALTLVGSCQRKPADEAAVAAAADSARQARLAEGQKVYLANCAMCHGEWGLGDGPIAAQLQKESGALPAHLNDRVRLDSMGRATLVEVIERGGAHTGRSNLMPPWGERLSPEEIEKIADFVMALPDLHREIPPSTMSKYLEAPPGTTAEGRRLFVTMCTACHGSAGKGDGRFADSMFVRNKVRPRDLTDSLYFSRMTDSEVFATISLGGGFFHKSPYMPVWGVSLTAEQINHLVSYIRTLSRTAPRS